MLVLRLRSNALPLARALALASWPPPLPPLPLGRAPAGWVVLGLPPGAFTLEQQVVISRSNTVLRGAGRDRTWLYLPKSMTDLFGGCLHHSLRHSLRAVLPGPGRVLLA